MGSRFTELIVDCADPERLASFWCEVLGWQVTERGDNGEIEISGDGPPELKLLFIRVPEPKTVKNRLHIDVNPVGADQHEELQRLLKLGARPADVGQGQQAWVVLADPEGNEFCLLHRRV
jgi:catechol 2,3-dioxygenase-like lactoylglutathione lyase family enzyme